MQVEGEEAGYGDVASAVDGTDEEGGGVGWGGDDALEGDDGMGCQAGFNDEEEQESARSEDEEGEDYGG